jgi:drug/metabolite transporter (DMT)-like permease
MIGHQNPRQAVHPRFQRPLAFLCLGASMALVGCYVALCKPLVAAVPIFLLGWMRFGIAGIAMASWWRKPADEPAMSSETKKLLFLESFVGNFLFSLCMLFGVSMTSAVSAGLILAAIPACSALMGHWVLGDRLSPRLGLSVACAGAGIGLLALSKSTGSNTAPDDSAGFLWSRELLGDILVFGAVLCESTFIVIGKKLSAGIGPKRIAAIINGWGFVLMTPAGLYWAVQFDFSTLDLGLWTLLIFYALAASVWMVWLWMTGMKTIPASEAGVFSAMLPVTAAAIGVLVFGENWTGLQALAFAFALLGLLLATLPSRKQPGQTTGETP